MLSFYLFSYLSVAPLDSEYAKAIDLYQQMPEVGKQRRPHGSQCKLPVAGLHKAMRASWGVLTQISHHEITLSGLICNYHLRRCFLHKSNVPRVCSTYHTGARVSVCVCVCVC
jgi:hypothetical protein